MSATTSISPARLAANRANAAKSTGPRTEAGKARSRANAVKHGLTGAGVALPGEDAALIEAEFLIVQEELAPATLLGMKLARRLALLTVRQDRAERFQAARLRVLARTAGAEFDAARVAAGDDLIAAIEASPRAPGRRLMAAPEGIGRLIEELIMLRADLTGAPPIWSQAHHRRLDALFGFLPEDLPRHRPMRYSRALLGDYDMVDPDEYGGLGAGPDRAFWTQYKVIGVIEAEIDRLNAHRTTLDLDAVADERQDALDLAAFDLDPDALLAVRYEAAAARDLSRTLRDFHLAESLLAPEVEAGAAALVDPIPAAVADPAPNPGRGPEMPAAVGSFGENIPAPPIAPNPAPVALAPAPTTPRRPVPTVAFTPPRPAPGP